MARFAVSPSRIARYYFHECDRYLRYAAVPKRNRDAEGVPPYRFDTNVVTRAILDGGYLWEEEVVRSHLDDVVIAADDNGNGSDGSVALHERTLGRDETLAALADAGPGRTIYQPTLTAPESLHREYGLDPDLVAFADCRPDLLVVTAGDTQGELVVEVVDVKASAAQKLSHRIQVGLYSLILTHVLADAGLDGALRVGGRGGVWLFEHDEPEWFGLTEILPPIETFLANELTPLLEAPAREAFWHLNYRCEWCDYFEHCRGEADARDDVSLVPYLSTYAKRHLVDAGADTVAKLDRLLDKPDVAARLAGCASLEQRSDRWRVAVDALRSGTEIPTGGASVAMPVNENVVVVASLQSDPLSGALYGYALHRGKGKGVFGTGRDTVARVAPAGHPAALAQLRRDLIADLVAILRPVHDHNAAHADAWRDQLSVQTYVFDSFERDLLVRTLLEAVVGETDPDVAADALSLLFHFQHPDLAGADDHPADSVFFPAIAFTDVVRTLFALPIPIAYRFADVIAALQPSEWGFDYRPAEYWNFSLSNRMRSDAILAVWTQGRADLVDNIEGELKRRVWATNAAINGLRERLRPTGTLFAWPPKFALPAGFGLRDPLLSRLAFINQYETVLGCLDVRTRRALPEGQRLAAGTTVDLVHLGGEKYRIDGQDPDALGLRPNAFANWILTTDTDDGRRARLAFDDFVYRNRPYGPKRLALALANVGGVAGDTVTLGLKPTNAFTAPAVGQRCRIDERFTDFNSAKVTAQLQRLDTEARSWFARLVADPVATRSKLGVEAGLREAAVAAGTGLAMTPSQQRALEGTADNDVQLVWGPPGTGKTHFLAGAILALVEAHRRCGRPFHVLATGFTHAAIDNLLGKILQVQAQHDVVGEPLMVGKAERDDGGSGATRVHPDDVEGWAATAPRSILGATVWGASKASEDEVAYDLVVVDEGSQVTVGEASIAIARKAPGGRLLIAGDDRQLPPIVAGDYPQAEDQPLLHRSILECLRSASASDPDGGDALTVALVENWRMCDRLCAYPAASIYPREYAPATPTIAAARLPVLPGSGDALVDVLLDPAYPMTVCVLEDVKATRENAVEADLVARCAVALRAADTEASDAAFWRDGLFVVSPHHAQIRAIRRRLDELREWDTLPFVGTVDKMQGQECDAVLVSYGVSDVEYALGEKEFIFSRNRLNVAITRARLKTVVFLSRALLEPPIQALDTAEVAEGIAFMQGLARHCELEGERLTLDTPATGRVTVLRA